MFTALSLAAALALGQDAGLKLTNVRMTVGELGPTRKDAPFLPGDIVFIGYDLDGLTVDAEGIAKYTMAMEVVDSAGKLIFKQDGRETIEFIPLGGNKLPARVFITIGLDQPPGKYSCKITATDPKTKSSASLTVPFEVLKPEFGIVAVHTSYDARNEVTAPNSGVVGQTLYVQFSIATFQRDPKTKQPNVEVLFEVLDEKGKPTIGQPKKLIQDSGVDAEKGAFGIYFPLYMNRAGKFTVRISATDKVSGKNSNYELPVAVLGPN